jgi:hypothetical protein
VVHSKITRRPPPANPRQHFGSRDAGKTYYIFAYVWRLSSMRPGGGAEHIRLNETVCKERARHTVQ